MVYALDTNIIIHLLNGTAAVRDKRDKAIEQNACLIIPPVVNYEMRRGFLYKPAPAKEELYRVFRSIFTLGEMNEKVWECAAATYANIRNAKRTAEDADILIAAFCIVNGCTLVTHNIKHYNFIDGLTIEDWAAEEE